MEFRPSVISKWLRNLVGKSNSVSTSTETGASEPSGVTHGTSSTSGESAQIASGTMPAHHIPNKAVGSMAGLLAAVAVILLFCLAATLLKTVAMGLLMVVAALPIYRWIAYQLWAAGICRSVDTARSTATFICVSIVIFLFIGFLTGFGWVIGRYWGTFRPQSYTIQQPIAPAPDGRRSFMQDILHTRPLNIIAEPLLEQVETIFGKGENREKAVAQFITDKALQFLKWGSGAVLGLPMNLVLTVYFFIFFLSRIGRSEEICRPDNKRHLSTRIVDKLFDTAWFPRLSIQAREEAASIIESVVNILSAWVRGYLTVIVFESFIYSLAFALIVGFPPGPAVVLGIIAGFTILLPFLGPLASIMITGCTYLVLYPDDPRLAVMLFIIAVIYAVMNVVENLILVPGVVGERLKLDSVETVIAVLLGWLWAGVPGMLLAVPAAAVIKYLVPQIYTVMLKSNTKT